MFGQTRNFYDLVLTDQSTATHVVDTGPQLGPAQKIKKNLWLSFLRKGSPVIVPEACKPLWFEKGWRRSANAKEYTGYFKVASSTWRGLILEPYASGYKAYIWNPPASDIRRNTSHGPCFSPNGETGRYQILFHSTPKSIDHVIVSVEEVLRQALNRKAR